VSTGQKCSITIIIIIIINSELIIVILNIENVAGVLYLLYMFTHMYEWHIYFFTLFLTTVFLIMFMTGCDDISAADVASLLKEAIQIGQSPSKWQLLPVKEVCVILWNEPFHIVMSDDIVSEILFDFALFCGRVDFAPDWYFGRNLVTCQNGDLVLLSYFRTSYICFRL